MPEIGVKAKLLVCAIDLKNLRASGLSDRTIRVNKIRTEGAALVFPYRDLDGSMNSFIRRRLHHPEPGGGAKYKQPKGSSPRAYFPFDSLAKLRDGTSPIYFTEGEKKALALSQLGLAAVGIGGIWCGTQKVAEGEFELIDDLAKIDWADRVVYIVFDYDKKDSTRRNAEAAKCRLARALRAAGAHEVYSVDLPPGRGGEKQGVDDYLDAEEADAFRELVERATPVPEINVINQNLVEFGGGPANSLITLIPPVLGEPAYHGWVGEFLRAVAEYTEATDAGVLAHLLPAAGTLIGPGPRIFSGGWQRTRVNTVLVGPTNSGRKGTSLTPVDLLMEFVDPDFWKQQRISGLATGEGLVAKVADRRADEGGIIVAEKRVYVVEEEFSKVFAQIKRDGNILSQIVREAFDGGNLSILTRGNPLRADGAHISMTGHITPEELWARFSGIEMANGFGNRFLWFVVKSDKFKPETEPIPERLFKFAPRLRAVADSAERCLEFDARAAKLWREEIYGPLKEDRSGVVGVLTARGAFFVRRLSLIYAMLDGDCTSIKVHHLYAALAVWRYTVESASIIFPEKASTLMAEKIVGLLKNGPMQKSKFTDHINRPVAEIDAALAMLNGTGQVHQSKVKTGGRPSEVWELVPSVQNGTGGARNENH